MTQRSRYRIRGAKRIRAPCTGATTASSQHLRS